uniref:Protein C10 n=1 Tax=Oncorhynchus mykiss TaxID=8022 RepID=A0A8K9V7M5_ONCMY
MASRKASLPTTQLTSKTFLAKLFVFIQLLYLVLSEVIQAFSVPENAARMEEARESACNDMGKMLQLVLPVATQIQQEVIKAYGFNNEGEGVLKFARLVKMYETQDPEIAAMSIKLKSLLLPHLSTPPIGGAITAS